ncbi:MAG: VWA domain-containing protein [Lentisphaeria bacterium]|nr:VWA domain-containing protein [Lentisphaeria bacterium]
MSDFTFQTPSSLLWILSLPILILIILMTMRWLNGLALSNSTGRRRHLRAQTLILLSILLAIMALARPGNDPQPRRVFSSGRDVVFLLDVSRSMLADDILPSRLERAKMAIISTLDALTLNDRVALVLFSGSATVVSPLTNDFSFFRKSVFEASRHSVSLGGTKLSAALVKSSEKVFTEDSKGTIDVIVLTDGEDQDSDLALAVETLNKKETQLILVGLGDRRIGSRLKQKDGTFLIEDGQEVWTTMKSSVLKKLAVQCTDGIYLDVGTKNINLGDVYQEIIKHKANKKEDKNKQLRYNELYQYFLFLSIVLLAWSSFPGKQKVHKGKGTLLLFLLFSSTFLNASEVGDAGFNEMEKRAQNMAKYIVASRGKVNQEELDGLNSIEAYNFGCNLLKIESYFKALYYFNWAEKSKHKTLHDFKIRYNQATCYYRIAKLAERLGVLQEAFTNVTNALEVYQSIFTTDPHNKKLLIALEATHLYHNSLLEKLNEEAEDAADSDSENGDSDSEEEGDEESETEKEAKVSENRQAGKPSDKAQKIPESMKSPEEILQEEIENNAKRDKGDDDLKPMKKDW